MKVNILYRGGNYNREVFDFIQDYRYLVDNGLVDELYEKFIEECNTFTYELTFVLLNSEIDPLKYVKKIYTGMYMFLDIDSIDIPDHITDIPLCAFTRCKKLTNVKLPSNLESIDVNAFGECGSLKEIYLPHSIKTIKPEAFDKCANLSDIYYDGTSKEWNKVTVQDATARKYVKFLK